MALLIAVTCGCGGTSANLDEPSGPVGKVIRAERVATDPTLGPVLRVAPKVRMQLPLDWVATPDRRLLWHSAASSDGHRRTFNIVAEPPRASGEPSGVFFEEMRAEYEAETRGVQRIVEATPARVGRFDALKLVVERSESGKDFKILQLVVAGERGTYYLTWTSVKGEFEPLEAMFLRASSTLVEEE